MEEDIKDEQQINDKYDIGLIGWWESNNYGSVITYFALRQLLVELGYSVLMISSIGLKEKNALPREFALRQGYSISPKYSDYDMYFLNNICNMFVVGSDQMWGIGKQKYKIAHSKYFLNFVFKNRKKICISASFGNKLFINKKYVAKYKKKIKRFDAISVREDYAVKMAKYYYNVDVYYSLDPVFLCDKKIYHKLAAGANITKMSNYILCYILDTTKETIQKIKFIQEKFKMPIKMIIAANHFFTESNLNNAKGFEVILASEEEWLAYILNSSLVITDSFHGTCLSLILEKDFITLINFKRGEGRFRSLSRLFKLDDRMVSNMIDLKNKIDRLAVPINYTKINRILEKKRLKDLQWIKDNLSSYNPEEINSSFFKIQDKFYNYIYMIKKYILKFKNCILRILKSFY